MYEREVANYPNCVAIWNGYNEMLKGYTFDIEPVDVSKECPVPQPLITLRENTDIGKGLMGWSTTVTLT